MSNYKYLLQKATSLSEKHSACTHGLTWTLDSSGFKIRHVAYVGQFVHVQVCKPPNPEHPAYAVLLDFLKGEVDRLQHEQPRKRNTQNTAAEAADRPAEVS